MLAAARFGCGEDGDHRPRGTYCALYNPMQPPERQKLSPFRKILAAVDNEPHEPQALDVLEQAVRLDANGDAELHIVHVVVPIASPTGITEAFAQELRSDQMQLARDYTDQVALRAATLFPGKITVHLVRAHLPDGIVHVAERIEADVVVVGTHDYRGMKRFFLGSVAAEVANRAPCPVLVARPRLYDAAGVPTVEPVCPDCAKTRTESAGATVWCARHAEHHPRAHMHYEYPQGFAAGSQILSM